MKTRFSLAQLTSLRQASLGVLWLLAAAFLTVSIWSVWQLPDLGVHLNDHNQVVAVDAGSSAEGHLQIGDELIGLPNGSLSRLLSLVFDEPTTLAVLRQGRTVSIKVSLAPASAAVRLNRLIPLMIALTFLVLAGTVQAFPWVDTGETLAVAANLSSLILSTGVLAPLSVGAIATLSKIAQWGLIPVLIDLHCRFPSPEPVRISNRVRRGLYVVTGLAILLQIAADLDTAENGREVMFYLRSVSLVVAIGCTCLLLLDKYRSTTLTERRRQIGIVIVGALLGVAPLVCLALLPEMMLGEPLLPYGQAFLWLTAVPVTYGLAAFRYRLLGLDQDVSRRVLILVPLGLVSALLLTLAAIVFQRIAAVRSVHPVIILALAAAIGATLPGLFRALQRQISHFVYGSWYDYRQAIQQTSARLETAPNPAALIASACRELQSALQIQCACGAAISVSAPSEGLGQATTYRTPRCQIAVTGEGRFTRGLKYTMESADPGQCPSDVLQAQLGCSKASLALPLRSGKRLHGCLVFGAKRGGGPLRGQDLDILETVARNLTMLMENRLLIQELDGHLRERQRYQEELLRTRESERQSLARELHDQTIQELMALNHVLADPNVMANHTVTQRLQTVIGQLRRICRDLRPPELDTLGLVPAMQIRAREVAETAGLRLAFVVLGEEEPDLSDDVATCLFRIFQEALQNVERHSQADHVQIQLHTSAQDVRLLIADDGIGFEVPSRLQSLVIQGHFGLVGMSERLALVQGKLVVRSGPQSGTHIEAWVPLNPSRSERSP